MTATTDTPATEVTTLAEAARGAAHGWGDPDGAAHRAQAIAAVADALDAAADELVPLGVEESGLPTGRLTGELARTTYQLRRFVDVLAEGSALEVTIDHADPGWALGPKPDLRRLLVAIGPVAVYAASNFPFAFSVAGGDTAAALAAGCPVVVKAHPGHPRLSARVAEIVTAALTGAGAPDGTFGIVYGLDAGKQLIAEPAIAAGAFTGSIPAGRALFDLAASRPVPVPFYGELGSINPAFVTRAAVAARGEAIATGFVGSYTLGVGQFCTKPGVLFLPEGHGLDDALIRASQEVATARMLNERVESGYVASLESLVAVGGVEVMVRGEVRDGCATPTLLGTTVGVLRENAAALLHECFGPTSLVVTYADDDELLAAAALFEGNLTATVHGEDADAGEVGGLLSLLRDRAGRLLWNGWPTGVAVTWGMQHGGPYPATTSPLFTSVGQTSIRRFLRPVSYQDMPDAALPAVLRREGAPAVVRRVDGRLEVPPGVTA